MTKEEIKSEAGLLLEKIDSEKLDDFPFAMLRKIDTIIIK